jgi:hypothetical protein
METLTETVTNEELKEFKQEAEEASAGNSTPMHETLEMLKILEMRKTNKLLERLVRNTSKTVG